MTHVSEKVQDHFCLKGEKCDEIANGHYSEHSIAIFIQFQRRVTCTCNHRTGY